MKDTRAILLGVAASAFFASTFVLNRTMNLGGGSWIWSASLRYLFMFPLLWGLVALRGESRAVHREILAAPGAWLGWSTLGFGIFYTGVCLGSVYGPSWLIAGTWQITIIMGALVARLFVPGSGSLFRQIRHSLIILPGIALIQISQAVSGGATQGGSSAGINPLGGGMSLLSVVFILVAAIAYPVGNRRMMSHCGNRLGTLQRVYGMTLASLPFWLVLSLGGLFVSGPPAPPQILQSLLVALCSGVIATLLFFKATDLAKNHPPLLAVVESTQAGEVLFTVLGGVLLLGDTVPDPLSLAGLALVVAGMLAGSLSTRVPGV